jgi:hypothetical protein
MNIKIFKHNEVDFDNINLGQLSDTQSSESRVGLIKYKQNNKLMPFLVQIPSLLLNDTYNGKNELILPLVCKNNESTESVCDFFNKLDMCIVSKLKSKLKEWNINAKNISYKAIVNTIEGDDDEVYENGVIRLRLIDNDSFTTKIYDNDRNLVASDNYDNLLVNSAYVKSIIEVVSIIINNDSVICVNIKPHQLRVSKPTNEVVELSCYSFDDNDSEVEVENKKPSIDDMHEALLNTQTDFLYSKDNQDRNRVSESECDNNSSDNNEENNDDDENSTSELNKISEEKQTEESEESHSNYFNALKMKGPLKVQVETL